MKEALTVTLLMMPLIVLLMPLILIPQEKLSPAQEAPTQDKPRWLMQDNLRLMQ